MVTEIAHHKSERDQHLRPTTPPNTGFRSLPLTNTFALRLTPIPFAQNSPPKNSHDPDNNRRDLYHINNSCRGTIRRKHDPAQQATNPKYEQRDNPHIFPPTYRRSLR
jgi:hypothetical protein